MTRDSEEHGGYRPLPSGWSVRIDRDRRGDASIIPAASYWIPFCRSELDAVLASGLPAIHATDVVEAERLLEGMYPAPEPGLGLVLSVYADIYQGTEWKNGGTCFAILCESGYTGTDTAVACALTRQRHPAHTRCWRLHRTRDSRFYSSVDKDVLREQQCVIVKGAYDTSCGIVLRYRPGRKRFRPTKPPKSPIQYVDIDLVWQLTKACDKEIQRCPEVCCSTPLNYRHARRIDYVRELSAYLHALTGLYGPYAYRQLPEFQKLKQAWAAHGAATRRNWVGHDSRLTHFCDWMDSEVPVKKPRKRGFRLRGPQHHTLRF